VPVSRGPRSNIGLAVSELAKNVTERRSIEDFFVSPNCSRNVYKFIAYASWKRMFVENRLTARDLFAQK